jgi:hypothetical protein
MNYYADGGQALASPIQEMPASQIIMNDAEAKEFGPEKIIQAIEQLVGEGKAVVIRENNSLLLLVQIGNGEVEVHLYTVDPPHRLASAMKHFLDELLKSDVQKVYGTEMPDKELIRMMLAIGASVDKSDKPDYYWMANVQ